jgi:GT2 family glycosyltransferase
VLCVCASWEETGSGGVVLNIVVVVVLYKSSLEESTACRTLLSVRVPPNIRLLGMIFDNTPGKEAENKDLDDNIEYCSSGRNLGLPTPYNIAMRRGLLRGAEYIMLIDQDSIVTCEFLEAVAQALEKPMPDQVAWVPRVLVNDRVISPYHMNAFGVPKFGFDQTRRGRVYFAINSYSVISLSFLAQLGGFEPYYWLDALDSWFYSRVAKAARTVGMIDATVTHKLSLLDGHVPPWRLINIARFEACYYWECLSPLQATTGTVRVLARGARHLHALLSSGQMIVYLRAVLDGISSGLRRR